ncbi:type IV pilus modification PilV family protein [Methylocapsa palsarum]|nr:prepilin-type N-terminal cleavage/methylation domain-containing protein [Methylocapsa palsarum]
MARPDDWGAVEAARRWFARSCLSAGRFGSARMSYSAANARECGGFTLIEALMALAITAVVLTSIASLMATNIRGSGRIGQHLELIEALREIHAELPDRAKLANGSLSGEKAGRLWSIDVSSFDARFGNPRPGEIWTPQKVVINVRSPSGAVVELETVRLRRRNEP